MKALIVEPGRVRLDQHRQRPKPAPGECLVRVFKAGICSTDLALIGGMYGFCGVLGHEFVGEVVEGDPAWLGKRVVSEINIGCGACEVCRNSGAKHCLQRKTLGIRGRDGAFADYITVPAKCLHEVPANVADDRAVFTEPLAAAFDVLDKASFDARSQVLILGDGRMAQLIARVTQTTGATISVLGKHAEKLARLPAGVTRLNPIPVTEKAFDIVIEATGNATGITLAQGLIKPRGTLILKSTYAGKVMLDATQLVIDEVRIHGSRCGPFDRALQALARREIEVESLIDAHYSLHDYEQAFNSLRQTSCIKLVFDLED
jgi:2-desacetyl-2-hydroxyethyl bacteriochlorophyllide A dehydrogenase